MAEGLVEGLVRQLAMEKKGHDAQARIVVDMVTALVGACPHIPYDGDPVLYAKKVGVWAAEANELLAEIVLREAAATQTEGSSR